MDTDRMDALTGRLDRLEADNRLWKKISLGLSCGLALLVILGTNLVRAPREVAAEKFVLRDAQGHSRAALELKGGGEPTLSLLDGAGRDQVVLKASTEGSSSLEYYDNRTLRLSVVSQKNVGSFFSLFNRGTRTRSEMFVWQDGTAGMEASRDLRGVSMQVRPDGISHLGFADKKGRERFGVGLMLDGTVTHHDEPRDSAADHLSISPEPKPIPPMPEPKLHPVGIDS